ncbi:transglutaminase-like cysteine peptidase [Sphingomicrobium nitratireducens]|uniref:transglutaminase-like cysteine peptidase n=1 Tax=Sphingomicrobium nitratireducens TaxID=2964666 RepID=UPI0022406DF7|nr:transglutaminase-like cysteine peptidase [Sphingomicrobium nitratireducens]
MKKSAHTRFALGALVASTLAAMPGSALAETSADMGGTSLALAARTQNSAKTQAILGGGSALAALLQQQGVKVTDASGALPRPAASPTFGTKAPTSRYFQPAPASRAAHPGRPDVFGSVAIEVERTPFDARWRSVAHSPVSGRAAQYARTMRNVSDAEAIDRINRYVNARVTFVEDRDQYRTADRWAAASQTLARGRGDCEDYAIAKMQMLRSAGFASKDLYLVVLKDLVRRQDHAVLVVRAGGKFWVLDNGTDRVMDAADVQDYRPILTYSAGRSWTHGYQRYDDAVPPLTLASAMPALKDGQRIALADIMPVRPAANR